MIVNFDGRDHKVMLLLRYDPVSRESFTCCTPEFPCPDHHRQRGWLLTTACDVEMSISGRPEKGTVTCLACLSGV